MTDIIVRVAERDDDVIAIHRFLCVVAPPYLPGPIDAKESIYEVWRVVNHDVALMAMSGDLLVGSFGIICAGWWWNGRCKFLANRWFFALPGSRAGAPLLREAIAIAKGSDLELLVFDEARERLRIFNKSEKRRG